MTPKEKCDELIEKFIPNMYCYMGSGMLSNDYDEKVALNNAKQCALITVNELIKELLEEINPSVHGFRHNYWKKVKQEIEAL
jgi:hypothetical protein